MWGNSPDSQLRNESPTTPNIGTADDYEDGDDYDDYNDNDDGCELKKKLNKINSVLLLPKNKIWQNSS